MARQKVATRYPMARVGNYSSPVDTSGMDPEMKNLMTSSNKNYKTGPKTPMDWLRKFLGVHPS